MQAVSRNEPQVRQLPRALDPDRCASCGEPCRHNDELLVRFCDECIECSNLALHPDGWVMLGGWD